MRIVESKNRYINGQWKSNNSLTNSSHLGSILTKYFCANLSKILHPGDEHSRTEQFSSCSWQQQRQNNLISLTVRNTCLPRRRNTRHDSNKHFWKFQSSAYLSKRLHQTAINEEMILPLAFESLRCLIGKQIGSIATEKSRVKLPNADVLYQKNQCLG